MPVCSYVVHPVPGRMHSLTKTLNSMKGCEVTPAKEHELLILVTETNSPQEEYALQEKLTHQDDIECLALAFGEIQASPAMEHHHE